MNFEVNGTRYFLGFNGEEGRWQLLTPTMKGIRRIDIIDDEAMLLYRNEVWDEPEETTGKIH